MSRSEEYYEGVKAFEDWDGMCDPPVCPYPPDIQKHLDWLYGYCNAGDVYFFEDGEEYNLPEDDDLS